MAYERWKQVVYDKNITEEESLAFYTTWAKHVRLCYTKKYPLRWYFLSWVPEIGIDVWIDMLF